MSDAPTAATTTTTNKHDPLSSLAASGSSTPLSRGGSDSTSPIFLSDLYHCTRPSAFPRWLVLVCRSPDENTGVLGLVYYFSPLLLRISIRGVLSGLEVQADGGKSNTGAQCCVFFFLLFLFLLAFCPFSRSRCVWNFVWHNLPSLSGRNPIENSGGKWGWNGREDEYVL